MKIETVAISVLQKDPDNARKHSARNLDAIAKSLEQFGQRKPIVVWQGFVIAGNGTLEAAQQLGWSEIAIARVPDDWSHEQARAYALADNRSAELAEWDTYKLNNQLIDLDAVGFEVQDWGFDPIGQPFDPLAPDEVLPDQDKETQKNVGVLAERFGIPPFSILDQRSGQWQTRKRHWLSLGIESELGRGNEDEPQVQVMKSLDGRVPNYYQQKNIVEQRLNRKVTKEEFEQNYLEINGNSGLTKTGISTFDPVLTEIMVSWFSRAGATVLDPFAGGSVRGIVTAALGRDYVGIELRGEQISANKRQAQNILHNFAKVGSIQWVEGDSNLILDSLTTEADMLFSCPPYFDLEVYGDDPADLSNMDYEGFLTVYQSIIKKSVEKLRENAFAAWVISEVRDNNGNYRGLVPETMKAFQAAGAHFYNEAILVSPLGLLAARVTGQFQVARKLGRTHQNVLIFVKGDSRNATERCGEVWIQPLET